MKLKVNGENIDVTLEDEKTVGDVLKSFESEVSKNDATTVKIVLNGEEITPDKFDGILETPLDDNTALELTVLSKAEIVEELKTIAKEIDTAKIENIPVLLQSGNEGEASAIIGKLAADCSDFFHAASMSSLFPELYSALVIDGKNLTEFFQDFLPILSDFKTAMEDKDTVTVGDLAEYEISPRLNAVLEVLKKL